MLQRVLLRHTCRRLLQARHARALSSSAAGDAFLLTGACGQVGAELLPYLRSIYGTDKVIASDVRPPTEEMLADGPFVELDVTSAVHLERVISERGVGTIVHLAALLSATGEKNPQLALHINNAGVTNVLEAARAHGLRVFSPSTIAVFGPSTPKEHTPDATVMRPTTMYGVTKVHLELLGEYYHSRYGVDFRSLRYPGVISSAAMPGGGTTDYAVEIFHEALACNQYTCFLSEDTPLPMMYMPDLLRATVGLIQADAASLTQRTYNVGALSFTPRQLAASIEKRVPNFTIKYDPDFRQAIAETWPQQLDDSAARRDWGWAHQYDLDTMTADMLLNLEKTVSAARLEEIGENVRLAAERRQAMMEFLAEETDGHSPVKL